MTGQPVAVGSRRAAALALSLCAVALVLVLVRLAEALPPDAWIEAIWHPAAGDVRQLVVHFSVLPRMATAALCGAGLAAAGAIVQQVMGNPLASPVTLGVSSGAQLALLAATLFAPAALAAGSDLVPLAGGAGAMGLVFGVASVRRFSSLALILSGLSVGLFCGALGGLLKLLHQEYLGAVLLWGAGSLDQQDWSVVERLAPRIIVLGIAAVLLVRPLRLLGLPGESASGLGLRLAPFRVMTLGVGVCLASTVTAAVGMIGFVEIAAPLLARLAGARTFGRRLAAAAAIGAALLVIVDLLVESLNSRIGTAVPTGAATAALSAPLVLWLLPRMRADATVQPREPDLPLVRSLAPPKILLSLAVLCLGSLVLAMLVGRSGMGWSVLSPSTWTELAPWRVPRVVQAFGGGAMAAAAGTLLQRTTGNPLASPELLGLGAAVMAGLAVALLVDPSPTRLALLAAGSASAGVMLGSLLWSGMRSRFAPDQMLLTGVALSAALDAVVVVVVAFNDARAGLLLGWLSGSTAGADAGSAAAVLGLACLVCPAALLFGRSLDLMWLGDPLARALGVAMLPTRLGVLLLCAVMTAGAVVSIGPLSFVGLIGPHLGSRVGLRRTSVLLPGAALLGGLLMALADVLGRIAIAPFELPAGLVAAMIGTPYLIACLMRR